MKKNYIFLHIIIFSLLPLNLVYCIDNYLNKQNNAFQKSKYAIIPNFSYTRTETFSNYSNFSNFSFQALKRLLKNNYIDLGFSSSTLLRSEHYYQKLTGLSFDPKIVQQVGGEVTRISVGLRHLFQTKAGVLFYVKCSIGQSFINEVKELKFDWESNGDKINGYVNNSEYYVYKKTISERNINGDYEYTIREHSGNIEGNQHIMYRKREVYKDGSKETFISNGETKDAPEGGFFENVTSMFSPILAAGTVIGIIDHVALDLSFNTYFLLYNKKSSIWLEPSIGMVFYF